MSTIKDVAERAGVSIGTVDRIIHNRGRFSAATAKRVKQAISDLNYTTNIQARNLSLSKKCHIAIVMPYTEQDSDYWQLPYRGMIAALDELASSHVSAEFFHYDRYDRSSLLDAIVRMSSEKFDAYIAAPLIQHDFLNAYKSLFSKKPVVFFDTDIEGSERMSYVGQDSVHAGRLAAKLIGMLIHDRKKKVLIVTPDAENNEHLKERVKGFTERIQYETDVLTIPTEPGLAKTVYRELSPKLGKIYGGVYVIDSSSHNLARLIEQEDCRSEVCLIGYDLVPDNVECLRKETIDFILTQRPFEQGYLSVKSLYQKVIIGDEIGEKQFMPIDIITKENLNVYLQSLEIN